MLFGAGADVSDAIEQCKESRQYDKGEKLFSEGSVVRGIFCICSGKVKLSQDGTGGREQIFSIRGEGHILGYADVVSDESYSCSAVAMEASRVCLVPSTPFHNLLNTNGRLAMLMARALAAELRKAERKVVNASQLPVRERIAQTLLMLKSSYGLASDMSTINCSITREEIAGIAGTTRETATRYLYELQEAGIINLEGKKISIRDEMRLWSLIRSKE